MSNARMVRTLPADDRTNGWSRILAPRVPHAALEGEMQFDWLVIGAGYAGLAAARQLAKHRPRETIALVDAGEVGENASGRNSGFAIDLPHTLDGRGSVEHARRSIRVARHAIGELERRVAEGGIDCGWSAAGRFHAAVTAKLREQALVPAARELERLGEPFEFVEGRALAERIGTRHYSAAIHTPGTRLLNPAALCRGLADSLPRNVTLFENSPVVACRIDGSVPAAFTERGSIRAGGVILAVNAFTPEFGVFEHRMVPIVLFASLSAPLTQGQIAQLGTAAEWGITPAHAVGGPTLRLTRDRRLLIRQGFEYSPAFRCSGARRGAARDEHLTLLRKRFPQLPNLSIEHFWMGWMAVSRNHAPAFGRVGPRAFAASCCNGVGIVRNTAAGMLIADMACGIESELAGDFLAGGTAARLPARPALDIGVRTSLWWKKIGSGAEA